MTPAALAALAMVLAADPLTTRIGEANSAAQALQGPLDGAWTLRDAAGRVLYVFQMSDPPGSRCPTHGAWRDGSGGSGHADFALIGQRRLRIRIEGATLATTFAKRGGAWRGRLAGHGAVSLTRGLAASRPPV